MTGAITIDLGALASAQVLAAFAVFCRMGAMMTAAPAFGDFSLSPRVRLAVALAVSAALYPAAARALGPYEAAAAGGPFALVGLLVGELAAGAFLGLAARTFAAALNVAGQVIALQMGLSLAQVFDPSQALQGAIIGGFFAVLGATLVFLTDLHHVLIGAVTESYRVFPPGYAGALLAAGVGDLSETMIAALSAAFALGVRLAAPFILFGLVFYVGAGVLNRLTPQAQVFFMLLPANLAIGLALLMATTGLIMTAYLEAFAAFLAAFLG